MILQRYTFGSKSQHCKRRGTKGLELLMILQRYTFGSKSQPNKAEQFTFTVAYDIAKIYIWKQITTG